MALSASVNGNDVTLTWDNPPLPFAPCVIPGSNYPVRSWEIRRNGVLLHTETRDAAHAAPNGFTSYVDVGAPDGNHTYNLKIYDTTTQIDPNDFNNCLVAPTKLKSDTSINVGVNSTDTTPDPFNLGSDVTGAARNKDYYSNLIQVTGINAPASISITGTGASYQVNNNGWTTTSDTVNQGDYVQVKITTASTFSTTRTATLTIGGVSDSWSVTTKADATGPVIVIPRTTPPISLQADVRTFFGPRQGFLMSPPAVSLTDYLRGGAYVPDISANSGVPTAPPIDLTDLLGSAVEWGFEDPPPWRTAFVRRDQTTFYTMQFLEGQHYALKKGNAGQAEYWWDVVVTDPYPDITVTTGPAALQTWTPDGFDFGISFTWTGPVPPPNSQPTINEDSGSASGTATLKVRSIYDPANTVIQASLNWSVLFI